MHIDELLRTPVGADLSRPQPIYRPSADVMMSAFNSYSALSRPQPIMNINDLVC